MKPKQPQRDQIVAGMILGVLFLAFVQIVILAVFKLAGIA